jgi:hypothetical protein
VGEPYQRVTFHVVGVLLQLAHVSPVNLRPRRDVRQAQTLPEASHFQFARATRAALGCSGMSVVRKQKPLVSKGFGSDCC